MFYGLTDLSLSAPLLRNTLHYWKTKSHSRISEAFVNRVQLRY